MSSSSSNQFIPSLLSTSNPTPTPTRSTSAMALAKRPQLGSLTASHDRPIPKNAQRNNPAFLTKLFTMVNDSETNHLIRWSEPSGDSFFVVSSERFGRELLPKYFKHSNFGSFVRQLNMYGFHKVPHLNQGVLQGEIPETEMLEFTNPHFQRGQPDMLCLIQRKKTAPEPSPAAAQAEGADPTQQSTSTHSSLDLAAVLSEIAAIRKHQALLSTDLKNLQSSNAHLWQEAIASRDRNKRCQETINKILGFLAQVFGGRVLNANTSIPTGVSPDTEMDSRDPVNDQLDYPTTSTTPAPIYNMSRLPRLMLEDVQRDDKLDEPRKSHVEDRSRRNATPKTPRRKDSHNMFAAALTSLASSPKQNPKKRSRFASVSDSPPEAMIDPNLETSVQTPPGAAESPPSPQEPSKQYSPDAVLQALFNENSIQNPFSSSDGMFSGINWTDLISTNESSILDNTTSTLVPPQTQLTSSSPLRITNGFDDPPSPSLTQPATRPNPTSHKSSITLNPSTQTQEISSIDQKVETLEAAIERLVGYLPKNVDDKTFEVDDNTNEALKVDNDNLASFRSQTSGDHTFDPDAFMKYFLSSDKTLPTPTANQVPKDHNLNDIRTAPIERSSSNKGVVGDLPESTVTSIQDPALQDSIDFDRILDEWTCDEALETEEATKSNLSPVLTDLRPLSESNKSSTTAIGPLTRTTSRMNDLTSQNNIPDRISTPDLAQLLGVSIDNPSLTTPNTSTTASFGLSNPNEVTNEKNESMIFNFDDVDQLRRIMGQKPETSGQINNPTNKALHEKRGNGNGNEDGMYHSGGILSRNKKARV